MGQLQSYVQQFAGGASALMHIDPKETEEISWDIEFQTSAGINHYTAALEHAAGDTLVFTRESLEFKRSGSPTKTTTTLRNSSGKESGIHDAAFQSVPSVQAMRGLLYNCRAFQFHDTSSRSAIRQGSSTEDRYLQHDGRNLAAYLLRISHESPDSYSRIVEVCREAIPWFLDFVLEPFGENNRVRLEFKERSGRIFQAHQASDGSLRFFALATLLCQPLSDRPKFICVDEPELGLHPKALSVLVDIMRESSTGSQVLMATQSRDLVKLLGVNPLVAERDPNRPEATRFRYLSPTDQDLWWDDYTHGAEFENRI